MGKGYDLKCAKCDYSIHVMEGAGMQTRSYHDEREVLKILLGSMLKKMVDEKVNELFDIKRIRKPIWEKYDDLKNIFSADETRDKIIKMLELNNKPIYAWGFEFDYYHKYRYDYYLYICPKCKGLFNELHFKCESSVMKYESKHNCPKCKVRLLPVVLNPDPYELEKGQSFELICRNKKMEWKCPECGNNKLVFEDTFCWD